MVEPGPAHRWGNKILTSKFVPYLQVKVQNALVGIMAYLLMKIFVTIEENYQGITKMVESMN